MLLNDLQCGSSRHVANRLITTGIVIELLLIVLIDYTPAGNVIFGTAPIPLSVWLFVLPFAAAMLGLEQLRKATVRRRYAEKIPVMPKFARQ